MAVFICQACGAEHSAEDGRCPECGATETIRLRAATDRMVDKVIKGKYRIVRKLGQGGMGAVYLAEQLGIGHRVALKFLKSEFSSDAEIARRFLNEAKSYARVAHPNAVTLHDFGQDEEGNLFIAMEYCEGVDLKKVISEQRQLPVYEAIEVVLQVADVLANAHGKGVVHRDLKPENIMIRRGMRGVHAKVLDFGIARLMDAGTRLTVAGAIAGTPRYMSPEQVEGREADLRADVYSLGIVLYEALTGVQPFDGSTIAEILRRQVSEPMPLLSQADPQLDLPDLDSVIQKACAKKREDRWQDMLMFANALSQTLPTQANLPALQRSGLSRVNATPVPRSATDQSAALSVNSPTDEGSGATVMRGSTPSPSAGTVGDLSPAALRAGAKTQFETKPLDASLPVIAPPKSKAPMVVAGAVALVLVAGGGWAVFSQHAPPAAAPTTTVAAVAEPPPRPNDAPPSTAKDPAMEVAREAQRVIRNEAALQAFGQARTSFELAKLDEAETQLKSIAEETNSYAEARQLLATIAKIRERLAAANRLRSAGDCPTALPVYQEVLRLNPKVAGALEGVSHCKAGMIDTTMEP